MVVDGKALIYLRNVEVRNRTNVFRPVWSFEEVLRNIWIVDFELLKLFIGQWFVVAPFS